MSADDEAARRLKADTEQIRNAMNKLEEMKRADRSQLETALEASQVEADVEAAESDTDDTVAPVAGGVGQSIAMLKEMQKVQLAMEAIEVETVSDDGLVTVRINKKGEIVDILLKEGTYQEAPEEDLGPIVKDTVIKAMKDAQATKMAKMMDAMGMGDIDTSVFVK